MSRKRKNLKIEGSDLWYLVGLITSDGNLSPDGRHMNITSKDYNFLIALKERLNFVNKVGIKNKNRRNQAYCIQISNKNFYEFLLSIGLCPNKSLIIETVRVPRRYFIDFLRGIIDGDGCIRRWIHPYNKLEQWSLRIYSGSNKFINWLNYMVELLIKVKGKIHKHSKTVWVLKYGKMSARELMKKCYYKNAFGLERKIKLAWVCINSYKGWRKSKLIL